MKLSVVIVNYNVRHFLEQCLLSVYKSLEGIEGEVFVVDNNSVDGSQQMLREKFPNVQLIENENNVGFSAANNQAIRVAKGEFVLLLNPDTVVEETTFSKIIQFMETHPDAGALGVKMIDGKGVFLPESKRGLPTHWVAFYKIFGLSKVFPKSKKFGRYHLTFLDNNKNHVVDVLSGAFMLMRKETLDKIGLLDEDFFMYGEDIDLSYRVVKGGWKNYYFAETKIIHYKGESTKKSSVNYVMVFYNAMIIFANKHFEKGQRNFFIFLIRLAVYFRAAVAIVNRIWKKLSFPLVEAGLIYLAFFGIKEYWEETHKLLKDGLPYPAEFDYLANPVYTVLFISLLWAAGAYKKPFRIRPLQTVAFSGFIAIATISYIIPVINFSRMIVGVGSMATFLISLMSRGVINFREHGNFFFTEVTRKRILIVGDGDELERIKKLIRTELKYPVEIEGTVNVTKPSVFREDMLGNIENLDEILSMYKIEEVVFANKCLPTEQIISLMSRIRKRDVQYKIVPPDVNYLVGPNVIHASLFNEPYLYSLDRKEVRFKKRVIEFITATAMIILYPLHFWMYKNPVLAFSNLWSVLRGEYHLVGYINENPPGLPSLKRGVLNMMHRLRSNDPNTVSHSAGLDRHYARSYSPELDLEILMKGFRKLGEVHMRNSA